MVMEIKNLGLDQAVGARQRLEAEEKRAKGKGATEGRAAEDRVSISPEAAQLVPRESARINDPQTALETARDIAARIGADGAAGMAAHAKVTPQSLQALAG